MSTGTMSRGRNKAHAQVPWLILAIVLIAVLVVPVQAKLNPDFTGTPRSGVAPLAVQFNDTSTGFYDHWEWDFGDGNTSAEQKPLYTYNKPGSYNVKLIISNTSEEQATIAQDNYITVEPALIPIPLNPDFTGTPRSGVTPLTVQFNDISTGPHDNWEWDFGDGNTSAEQKPLYTYNKPGSYNVKLTISNAGEEQATINQDKYIAVEPALIPVPLNSDFTGTPRSGVTPLTVQFNDISTGPHDIWEWDFGDGNTSAEQKPLYTYDKPGSYNVKLTISNASGEQATITEKDYITVNPAPSAGELILDFSGTPRSGVSPLTVKFNDASTGFVEPVSYVWDFGDGNTSTEQNPLYTYNQQGSYTVTLNVSQSVGAPASIAKNKYITVEPPLNPVLLNPDFTGTPRSGVTPLTVRFNDTSTGPHDHWGWDFGDGNTSAEQKPLYTYDKPGSYNIKLTISNASGEQATITEKDYITVNPAPSMGELILDFNGTPRSGTSPLTVQFTDKSTGFVEPVSYLWDFGDGNTSSKPNPLYTYNKPGSYTIKLDITQASGSLTTISKNNYISITSIPLVLPVADFFGVPTSGIAPLTVTFTDLSTNTPIKWNWSFGDNSLENATEQNPVHTFTNTGNYTVSLNATNADGSDTQTRTKYITVNPAAIPLVLPVADFFGVPTSGIAPLTVIFTDLSTNTPIKWNWSFGDNSLENATEQTPVHTFTNTGNYTVSLNATNADGSDTQTRTKYIIVKPAAAQPALPVAAPPLADFFGLPTSGIAPLNVIFTDLSTNTPTSWNWSFGDNSLENTSEQNPVHTFTKTGNYTVSLNATNADGSDTQTRNEYISVNPAMAPPALPVAEPPLADFFGVPTSGIAPLTVTFTDLSTNTPIKWNWSFGDDSLENTTEQNPVHTYINPGNYTVSLNASNADGSDTQIREEYIKVRVIPLAPPVADFSGKPTNGVAPLTVTFTDSSTNTPITWKWSFGDDSLENTTEQNPVHTYINPGNYTVSLNATNADGNTTKKVTDYIIVSTVPLVPLIPEPLIPNFTAIPTSGPAPLIIQFNDTSTGPHDQWVWEFGDGNISSEQNPLYTFNEPGSYSVLLNVSQAGGETVSKTQEDYITVVTPLIPIPLNATPLIPKFTGTPTSGPAPLTVQFNDTSTGQHDQWVWNFGDGNTSSEQNPLYTFNEPGSYSVLLNVSQAGGEAVSKTQEDYITVSAVPLEPPVVDFSGEPTSGVAPLTVIFADSSSNTPTSWYWSFGDDSTENVTARNPVHTYTNPGTYSVSLNATNTVGLNVTTKTSYINVTAAPLGPVADFSGTPTSGFAPLTVQFNDISTGFVNPVTYLWDFGDGSTSTERNPSHTYTANTQENYTVAFNVSGNYGKTDSRIKSGYITIEIPTIELIISDSPPDQSLLSNGSIPPEQTLSQAQSLPQSEPGLQGQSLSLSKSAPRVQSLPQSKSGLQDPSLPQDISTQNRLSADSGVIIGPFVGPSVKDWKLNIGDNPKTDAFWMGVGSNIKWKVEVKDAMEDGKQYDIEGCMRPYDYSNSEYVPTGKSLKNAIRLKAESDFPFFESGNEIGLSEKRQLLTGNPPGWIGHINLYQLLEPSDGSLGTGKGYRIVITFEASNNA